MKEFNKIIEIDDFKISFNFSKDSIKFLKNHEHILLVETVYELIVKGVKKLNGITINIDIIELHGNLKGYYRILIGNIGIIFQYIKGEIHIENIESISFRGDVYKKKFL